jgi:hypothetical protein
MLFEAVIERSIDEMDEPSLKEFESLIGTVGEDYRQVITFLTKHVSGFQSIVSEELSRLKRTSSGIFA